VRTIRGKVIASNCGAHRTVTKPQIKVGHRPLPGKQAPVRPTTIIESQRLAKHLGVKLILASETFQHTGSFKFRAAYSVASRVEQELLITASSGNFGQALAYACSLLKKSCIVVMPSSGVFAADLRVGGSISRNC
jgi:threonine synthase